MPIECVRTFRGKDIQFLTKVVKPGHIDLFVDSGNIASLRNGHDSYRQIEIGDNGVMRVSQIREGFFSREEIETASLRRNEINDEMNYGLVRTRKVLGFQTVYRYKK